jgi:hypothetical protein
MLTGKPLVLFFNQTVLTGNLCRKYVGDGFKAKHMSTFGHAKLECQKSCSGIISSSQLQELQSTISRSPVALYGWGGCPCTDIARTRFDTEGVCYTQAVWPEPNDPVFKFLQCKYGEDNHSFIFFKGAFFGNGFKLAPNVTPDAEFQQLINHAGARESCIKNTDLGLDSRPIKSCTQSSDGTTTGWTRTGTLVRPDPR